MTQRVVDRLEAVEIEFEDADAVAEPLGVTKLGLQLAREQRSVRQSGQRVLQCPPPQLLLAGRAIERTSEHVRHGFQEAGVLVAEWPSAGAGVGDKDVAGARALGHRHAHSLPDALARIAAGTENRVSPSRSLLSTGPLPDNVNAVWVG